MKTCRLIFFSLPSTPVHIVCRPTEQEAKDYLAYYVDQNADWEGSFTKYTPIQDGITRS